MKNDIENKVKDRVEAENDEMEIQKIFSNLENTPYFIKDHYLCRGKKSRGKKNDDENVTTVYLAEFLAWIGQETITDNGKEILREFQIKGLTLKDRRPLPGLNVQAGKFSGLTWTEAGWGSRAILFPGATVKDNARHCFQIISGDVKTNTFYGHTGWQKIDGEWVFLHAGGAIGGNKNISVKLSQGLNKYLLPPLPQCKAEKGGPSFSGLEASLSFLKIGPASVTFPLWSFIFLAPLTTLISPMPNFVLFLHGISGTFKSTLAILANSHFGNFKSIQGLSNFSDTPGNLEYRSFILKDVPMIIDDLHPANNKRNAEVMETTAQKLIRAYSNRTGRSRLNSDSTDRGHYEPRGLCIMTAEEMPALESTLARLCVVNIEDNTIDRARMTALQEKSDLLPHAGAAYISWIKKNMENIVSDFPALFRDFRAAAANDGQHKKLPEQVAFLAYGLHLATSFFKDSGIITDDESERMNQEGWQTFIHLSDRQQQRITDDNPVDRFFDILQTLLIQHNARLEPLPSYEGFSIGAGDRIGYFDNQFIYLLPVAAWHCVSTFSSKEGGHFPLGKHAFFAMLKSKKIIEPSPKGESTVFLKIDGKVIRVLKIIEGGVYRKTVISVTE